MPISINIEEVLNSYLPRNAGLSFVQAYQISNLLPTELESKLNNSFSIPNPDYILVSSGKNNNLWFKKSIQNFRFTPEIWNLEIGDYFCGYNLVLKPKQPEWLYLITEFHSFKKLFEAQNLIQNFRYIPFIKQIYICGSAATEQSNKFSDVDLILVTQKFGILPTSLITRFWAKTYLKLTNHDVHPFIIYYLYKILKNLGFTKIATKFEEKYSNFKNNSNLKIDIGLVTDLEFNPKNYTSLDADRLGFVLAKKVLFEKDILNTSIDSKSNFTYFWLNDYKFNFNFFKNAAKFILSVFSLIFYPVFWLQIIWFRLFNSTNLNQFVSPFLWHAFSKIGFSADRIVKIPNQIIYSKISNVHISNSQKK